MDFLFFNLDKMAILPRGCGLKKHSERVVDTTIDALKAVGPTRSKSITRVVTTWCMVGEGPYLWRWAGAAIPAGAAATTAGAAAAR